MMLRPFLLLLTLLLWACQPPRPFTVHDVVTVEKTVEVPRYVLGNLVLDWPIKDHKITSRYGFRDDLKKGPTGGGDSIHFGLDLIPQDRTKIHAAIFAAAPGKVTIVYPAPNKYFRGHSVFGGCVQLQHDTGMRSASGKTIYLYTFYAHLSDVWVVEGQTVTRGERIGTMGNTGQAEGYHLHFEVSFDPLDFMDLTGEQ